MRTLETKLREVLLLFEAAQRYGGTGVSDRYAQALAVAVDEAPPPDATGGAGEMPPHVRLALKVVLNHVEPGWDNCAATVRTWLEEA